MGKEWIRPKNWPEDDALGFKVPIMKPYNLFCTASKNESLLSAAAATTRNWRDQLVGNRL